MQVQKSANDWKDDGNKHFKSQDYASAIKCYTKAIQLNPNQPSYFSNRAACYINQKKFDNVILDCNKAIELDPNFTKALRRRAIAYMNQLKFDESLSDFKKALLSEKDLTIQRQMQDCQALQKNYKQIFDDINQNKFSEALLSVNYILGKIQSRNDLLVIKCQLLANTGDIDGAKNVIQTIQTSNVSSSDINYLKGLIELYSGDSNKAKKYLQQALKLDPNNQKFKKVFKNSSKGQQLKQKGNQFLKQAKYKQAADVYSQALLLDPSNKKLNSILFSNRALTFMKQKQTLKALDDLNKSLQLDPKYTKSLVRRAEIHTEREDYSAAIQDYSKIQEVDSSTNYDAKIKDLRIKQKKARKKDYYGIMGLTKPSNDADIKKAYKKLAVQYHPDKNRSKSEAQQQDAQKKFRDLNQAYGVLSDTQKKQLYDSGQIQYDGDDSSMGGMGGFGGMGGMGNRGEYTFSTSGGQGIDPNQIFKMFGGMGGFGGFGGDSFSSFGGGGGGNKKYKFSSSSGMPGGMGGMFGNFKQKK